ncbi:hypothetical protein WR25_07899 [Diploscapter pachys]|uniref:Uncharacterized protein n=1 Tax=Diploscapter pachys TaxID=2018661 RepID=A0A2A2LRD4_9BILA|nr:hypothetical protein WR25_07899 [Diploscapter pachys]
MAAAAPASYCRVVSLNVAPLFESAKDNQLVATVDVENQSEFTHSCQVVFRGYVRRPNELLYEFLHEQQWIIVKPSSTETQDVAVDVWLPRFPPSMQILQDLVVEYSVKATVDPWYENHHIEKKFDVARTLILKMPHTACFAKQWIVNECVGHNKWIHKKCSPINGEVWTDKGAYTFGEHVRVKWTLHHEDSKISDPGHPMLMEKHNSIVASKQVKADGQSDSEEENEDPQVKKKMREQKDYSVDIEKLKVIPGTGSNGLKEANAVVDFVINSNEPKPLGAVRLLLQGEARAGSMWYEFVRFKAIVCSNEHSHFSPGQHKVQISLPFRDSQYDVNILPPTLGDDIRYVCRASGDSWRKNIVPRETDIMVDRYTDTWGRAEFKPPYSEQKGAIAIKMRQRNFQRGKSVLMQVEGKMRKLQLQLVQQRRLRIPGLSKQESYCHERVVSVEESPSDENQWPSEWSVPIPPNVPPSIEISYWNVLFLSYQAVAVVTLEDGHNHTHKVPIWIGCTDDNLERLPNTRPIAPIDGPKSAAEPELGELPPFEVVHPEEIREQPYWVERFNDHTYGYMS